MKSKPLILIGCILTLSSCSILDKVGSFITPILSSLINSSTSSSISTNTDSSSTLSSSSQNICITSTSSGHSSSSSSSSSKPSSTSSQSSSSSSSSSKPSTSSSSHTSTSSDMPPKKASYTVMIYLCGSNLESESGYLCTKSITNILSVSGQPDDVNIIIETGGAKKWSSKYSIRNDKLQRWHVRNKTLVLDETLTSSNNMATSSSFQSFIEWGLTSYPAEKTAVILSGHGNAMWGACFDENNPLSGLGYDWDDGLTNDEVYKAFSNAFTKCNQSTKLEWIGYDACLMQMQDVAEFNSKYFNYMVASQENEAGNGWDYANWLDDLYAKKDTKTILKEICDTYIVYAKSQNQKDCTLSYLDLTQMGSYFDSFETLADSLKSKISTSNKSSFISLVKNCKKYGSTDSSYYGSYDVKDFLNKLSSNSTFNPGSNYISDVLDKYSNLVSYSKIGQSAGNSNGLCLFFSTSSDTEQSTYYNSSMTNFSNWRYLSNTFGL